jgi:hypothetical protein
MLVECHIIISRIPLNMANFDKSYSMAGRNEFSSSIQILTPSRNEYHQFYNFGVNNNTLKKPRQTLNNNIIKKSNRKIDIQLHA